MPWTIGSPNVIGGGRVPNAIGVRRGRSPGSRSIVGEGVRKKWGESRETIPDLLPENRRKSIVPKVGLEPTRVLPHRILSPARLPFRHFGYMWLGFMLQ